MPGDCRHPHRPMGLDPSGRPTRAMALAIRMAMGPELGEAMATLHEAQAIRMAMVPRALQAHAPKQTSFEQLVM